MYDIHSHIIYGVDDGSLNADMSRGMLKLAASTGTQHLVATPHVIEIQDHPSWEMILAKVEELRALAQEENLNLTLYPGAEVMLSQDILAAYDEAPHAFCLNNTQYALVELPMLQVPLYTEDVFYEMQLRGLTPVLAHPERYPELFATEANLGRLLDWCRSGVLLQCNAGSILGKFGPIPQENLELLLHNKLISFIGSDGHRLKQHNTDLAEERKRLTELCGASYVQELCCTNPQALLAGQPLDVYVPYKLEPVKKPSFWKRLFG